MTLAAAEFVAISSAVAQPGKKNDKNIVAAMPWTRGSSSTTFGPLKQIDAGLLNVGYAEAGPANGPAVLLLHGWPYDIYSFVDVTPLLASAGSRINNSCSVTSTADPRKPLSTSSLITGIPTQRT